MTEEIRNEDGEVVEIVDPQMENLREKIEAYKLHTQTADLIEELDRRISKRKSIDGLLVQVVDRLRVCMTFDVTSSVCRFGIREAMKLIQMAQSDRHHLEDIDQQNGILKQKMDAAADGRPTELVALQMRPVLALPAPKWLENMLEPEPTK